MTNYDLYHVLAERARKAPKADALLFRDENGSICRWSVAEVAFLVFENAKEFAAYEGKRVGILGANSPEWLIHAWGALTAGVDLALLDSSLPVEDLENAIAKAGLDLIWIDRNLLELKTHLEEELAEKYQKAVLFHVMKKMVCDPSANPETNAFPPLSDEKRIHLENTKVITFSSGTSKNSKIVVGTVRANIGNFEDVHDIICAKPGDLVLNCLPFHHSYGFTITIFYYMAGCPVFISSMRTLKKDIRQVQPVILPIVPSAGEYLLKKKLFGSSVKYVLISGAFCSTELAGRIRDLGIVVQNRYGSSEVPCAIGENLPGDEVDCITPHRFAQLEISSDGELLVHTDYHFLHYLGDPEETREVLNDDTIYTGDMAFLDTNGKLHLLGRRKNMIVMENGEKVFLADMDQTIKDIDGVGDGAVIYKDHMLIAVVSMTDQTCESKIREAIDRYNQDQAYYRKIQRVWFYRKSFPYTSSGKLQRRLLEAEWDDRQ